MDDIIANMRDQLSARKTSLVSKKADVERAWILYKDALEAYDTLASLVNQQERALNILEKHNALPCPAAPSEVPPHLRPSSAETSPWKEER